MREETGLGCSVLRDIPESTNYRYSNWQSLELNDIIGCGRLEPPRAEIVKMFDLSLATLRRYLEQRREIGHAKPKASLGRLPKKLALLRADLVSQLEAYPDAKLDRHGELWEQAHVYRSARGRWAVPPSGWAGHEKRHWQQAGSELTRLSG